MKYLMLCLSISLTIVCCTSSQEHSLLIFNEIEFDLGEGEEVVEIDLNKKEVFDSYFDEQSIQIPLFRCIQSDGYLIFIGIPFNTSIKELTNDSMTNTLTEVLFEGDSTNYLYKTYSNEKEEITIHTQNFDNNLVYVLAVSDSPELSDSLFNLNALSNRFKN